MAWLAILTLSLCSACATTDNEGRCDVTSIRAVFADPMRYQDMWFCGEGYLYERSELTGIYDQPITSDERRFEMAFLLDADTARATLQPVDQGVNVRVYVRGRIDAALCNSTVEVSCTPVARAIFLMESRTRPVHSG